MKVGQSALHVAARVGNAECVRCLLLAGAATELLNKVRHLVNSLRLYDYRHTTQSNTTNIHHAGRGTQQPPRRAALYTEG